MTDPAEPLRREMQQNEAMMTRLDRFMTEVIAWMVAVAVFAWLVLVWDAVAYWWR